MRRRRLVVSALVLAIVATGGLYAALRTEEYDRVTSPDGRHVAVATYRVYQACLPRMPGGGGDKPGFVTVYTRAGRSCGRTPVGMVSALHSLQWEGGVATIPLTATWYLSTCRLEE